jgi:hypothetical protein
MSRTWQKFFRGVDQELSEAAQVFWTMTAGRQHKVRWIFRNGKWSLSDLWPEPGTLKASYLSCIHRVPDRVRFWRRLYNLMGDGGRVIIATQGCQAVYPIPPRLAGSIPDAPSVGALLSETAAAGFASCCAKVHLIRRSVPRNTWIGWLKAGCFSDMDYLDQAEIEAFSATLPEQLEVGMAYYILVGIKLAHQNGLLDLRPSAVHGLTACTRTSLPGGTILLVVPVIAAPRGLGTKSREWHQRRRGVGLHVCSTSYRLFNHSTQPNCQLSDKGVIRTLRPVMAGEELTLDYEALPTDE